MKVQVVLLIAKQFFKKTFYSKGLLGLLAVFISVIIYVTIDGWKAYENNHHITEHHQNKARKSWEDNPDKHPHRMAHFGTFAFREQHPLTIFDSGIESYTGNAIFLEAHRQNTANFSEASLSTGLVRFGDLNIAMLLQLILPLIVFFVGYSAITSEKENGTLKIYYTQGINMKDILFGKSIGLFLVSSLFFIPGLIALWSITKIQDDVSNSSIVIRTFLITVFYILFYLILSFTTVIISGKSTNSNRSLLTLLGGWLLFFIIIPKTSQVIGNSLYPNLSKIAFRAAVEEEVSKQGDSHNPNDPYFNGLKDSILKVHNVTDVKELPFNYSGFLMSKGEEQTATIYNKQHKKLIDSYKNQNSIANRLVILNPYLAIKNLSMSLSGTDFNTYVSFLNQTEDYRYKQSQYMNELQMKFISNKAKSSEGKVHVVKKEYWLSAPQFSYQFIPVSQTINNQFMALITLIFWFFIVLLITVKFSNRFKII
ncbi:MAG: DUF3526 domain-containing protein [Tenacibaculum sp.]|nr:DUF3526 domain-containing protein [Tenacibaculum sp.]